MGYTEGWELVSVASGRRVGWYGYSTRTAAEAWFAREVDKPYRPAFYMRGVDSRREIRRTQERAS